MGVTTTIEAADGGTFGVYRADPAGAPRGAIIVIQEIFGVNPGIRAKCDLWAGAGYLALAPDLFWRIEPGIELDPDVPAERDRAFGLIQKFDLQVGMTDVEATIRAARAAVAGGKVGLVGFCLGGRIAYLAAARTDIDASVGYYGVGLDALLGERHAIANPLMLHIPVDDKHVGPEAQAAVHAGLDPNPHCTLHDYPGADHGFATQFGERRNAPAAELADARTAAFFAEHIG